MPIVVRAHKNKRANLTHRFYFLQWNAYDSCIWTHVQPVDEYNCSLT